MDNSIESQGSLADAKLAALQLTLTQGSEPTFVPHNTMALEWNSAALGPEKLRYALLLARDLVSTLCQGGVILRSSGKRYPDEPSPRWQVGIYRSRKGEPLWSDLRRLRLDQAPAVAPDPAAPKKFIQQLARALGLQARGVPVYEDFEASLRSIGSDAALRLVPRFSRSKRAFVSRPLTKTDSRKWQTVLEPAGWVLPLDHDGRRWRTDRWKGAPRGDLTLIPGAEPVGLRLPDDTLRCGITVEIRNDEFVVCMPRLPTFRAFVELSRRIELLAMKLGLPPVRLEGYPPTEDEDLESITLTPDPGVLEVNLPPKDNWPDFERIVRGVFASATAVGLRAAKYQMSGRKVSTGGGAHIILGGPDLQRNPFIEHPVLLSGFLRFVQNHPSLSYAFSGLFTGLSSQAPRVDESALGLPYELEITLKALESMPRPGDATMMDAMLRNLLMDWNGNTHRAELNVDKFHHRYALNGRKGLIEFRAFEMMPTPEMLLATHALMRALAVCLVERPYEHPLINWGEALHDRFALPWFLRQDLKKVVSHVNQHGFSFESNCFEPHLEFRFPVLARFSTRKVNWTLRQALEPWPVMGAHQGTSRFVDATTDRLELLAEGITNKSGLAVSCNGVRMPLVHAGRSKAVGAVRYRLFDNPDGLQPHISAHSPLRLEVIDLKSRRILHAIDYRNWKKGGGDYEAPPTTDAEAQQRVAQRIEMRKHARGRKARWREITSSPRAPFTLDLRRC